ncbi:nuclear transport factor 2 family protein [uncultured Mycobacterium sp.]|uniref:nuclear transport factor 2 family protein n=1 Tax=uncultured Mycobacterium sp. TaxID=171292 RepID=UPI0035CC8224
MSAETQITNLLYRYAEYMDSGDLAAAASLFQHARLRVDSAGDGTVDAAAMLAIWKATVVLYPNGTPRTKHLVTNPVIQVDEDAGTASCRSYYTVLQQTDDLPLQPIVAGRYHDRFECVNGAWRFCFRDYTLVDMVGDLSRHLIGPIAPGS